jgi:hypothetical protein
MSKRLTLVTGASAGIGAAIARAYAKRGWDLALTARRGDRLIALAAELEAAHGAKSLIIPDDLADPGAPQRILTAIADSGRTLDGLVNNAGYGQQSTYATSTWADQARFIQVMMTAPAELAHRALPGMLERGYGRIMNVASLAGLLPGMEGHTLYGAVKAFLIKFSQALRAECEGRGVQVSALCPGLTHSEFHETAGLKDQFNDLPRFLWQHADDVAEEGVTGLEANQAIVVTGGMNKSAAALAKLLPDAFASALMRNATDRKG